MTCAPGRRASLRPAIALGLLLAVSGAAAACPVLPEPVGQPALAQSSSAGGARPLWDWRANAARNGPRADQAAIVRAVDRQRLGHGSWICSPAGSGMRSSCFER